MAGSLSVHRNQDLRDIMPAADMPLPFLTGNGRSSGGGNFGGGNNGGGFGDF
jgi:hypothetical protein